MHAHAERGKSISEGYVRERERLHIILLFGEAEQRGRPNLEAITAGPRLLALAARLRGYVRRQSEGTWKRTAGGGGV